MFLGEGELHGKQKEQTLDDSHSSVKLTKLYYLCSLTFRGWNASCLAFSHTPTELVMQVGQSWCALLLSMECQYPSVRLQKTAQQRLFQPTGINCIQVIQHLFLPFTEVDVIHTISLFERIFPTTNLVLTVSEKKAALKVFLSNEEMCQLSPLNRCENQNQ